MLIDAREPWLVSTFGALMMLSSEYLPSFSVRMAAAKAVASSESTISAAVPGLAGDSPAATAARSHDHLDQDALAARRGQAVDAASSLAFAVSGPLIRASRRRVTRDVSAS